MRDNSKLDNETILQKPWSAPPGKLTVGAHVVRESRRLSLLTTGAFIKELSPVFCNVGYFNAHGRVSRGKWSWGAQPEIRATTGAYIT
jgi:hypothetical protein